MIDDRPLSETSRSAPTPTTVATTSSGSIDAAEASLDAVVAERRLHRRRLAADAALPLPAPRADARLLRHELPPAPQRRLPLRDELAAHEARADVRPRRRRAGQRSSESRFAALYKTEPRITASPTLLVSDYITANLADARRVAPTSPTRSRRCSLLADAPTAQLERAFAEHVDILQLPPRRLAARRSSASSCRRCVRRRADGDVPLPGPASTSAPTPGSRTCGPRPPRGDPVELPADLEGSFGAEPPIVQRPDATAATSTRRR